MYICRIMKDRGESERLNDREFLAENVNCARARDYIRRSQLGLNRGLGLVSADNLCRFSRDRAAEEVALSRNRFAKCVSTKQSPVREVLREM